MRRNRRGSSSDDESTTININVTNIDASTTHIRPGPTRSGGGGKGGDSGGGKGGGSGGNKGGGRSVAAPIKKVTRNLKFLFRLHKTSFLFIRISNEIENLYGKNPLK